MTIRNSIVFFAFSLLSISCQKSDSGSESQYALMTTNGTFSTRLLWNHLKTTPKLRVCLAMLGFESSELEAESSKVKNLMDFAVLGWVKLLDGHKDWRNKTLATEIKVQTTPCENANGAPFNETQVLVKLHWYKTNELFKKQACINWSNSIGDCRSYASVPSLKINLFFDREKWPAGTDRIYLAHEFGHLLGLGDTYTIPGVSEPISQPPSVMNVGSQDFTEDDRMAVWATYEVAMGRPRKCGDDAIAGSAKANVEKHIFCLPGAKTNTNHGPGSTNQGQ